MIMNRLSVVVLASWLAMAGLGSAQEKDRPWGFLSPIADLGKKDVAPPLDLRTNVKLPLYLYLVNSSETDALPVKVEVSSGGVVIATAATKTLPPNSFGRFALTVVPSGKPGGEQGAAVAVDPKTKQLSIDVAVSNANKPTEAANVVHQVINFVAPSSFLGDTTAAVSGTGNQLVVSVKANNLQGPPCEVELVLSPNEIPGLQLGELKGVTRGILTAEQPSAKLVAGGLAFAPGSSGDGRLSLTVDGIERAVVMKGSFRPQARASSEPFVLETKREMRLIAQKTAKPGEDVAAKLEATNAADNSQVTFTVSPGLPGTGTAVQTQTRSGPREQRAVVKVGDDGAMLIHTIVKDWAFHFDTRGLYGPVTLKAVVVSGDEIKDTTTVVVFDDTPPKNLQFIAGDPMKPPVRGRKYAVRTYGEDKDSDIAKVECFVGAEPPVAGPDGKLAAEPKPVIAVMDPRSSKEAPAWLAAINLPEKKGTVPVFVRFTNGVGLSTVAKYELDVLDPPNGSIKGKVIYGDKAQGMGVTVWLMNKDGKTIVKDTKATAEGKFEISDVPVGDYVLVAEQKGSGKPLTAAIGVVIREGPEATEQNITLKK